MYSIIQPKNQKVNQNIVYFWVIIAYNKYYMECKFLSNGIAIQYHNFIKPCCTWRTDSEWINTHQISKVDLVTWHQHPDLVSARQELAQGIWPKNCQDCQTVESQGRQDSIRLGGASEYQNFSADDLTLEIRPGSVCNFACQTCWTPASTRVAEFYRKADIYDPYRDFVKNNFVDFKFLDTIKHRLKKIIVLGGEPFYDPKCLEFIRWSIANTSAELMMFTNGSTLDFELLNTINRKITLIFSLDAVGKPAEYVRFGTDWPVVWNNYLKAKQLPNVVTRVNITTSPYNYYYFPDVLDLLVNDWPEVVSFGPTAEEFFCEQVVPYGVRAKIISRLEQCVPQLLAGTIPNDQKYNAVNAVQSLIINLKTLEYSQELHAKFVDFVTRMDAVKNIQFADHCVEMADLLVVDPG